MTRRSKHIPNLVYALYRRETVSFVLATGLDTRRVVHEIGRVRSLWCVRPRPWDRQPGIDLPILERTHGIKPTWLRAHVAMRLRS